MSATKDKFIEETGGFRFGETPEAFQARTHRIEEVRAQIAAGGTVAFVEELARLLGTDDD